MKKVLALILLFPAALGAKSLWEDGGSIYRVTVNAGDILRIRFGEKQVMKYKMEQKSVQSDDTKGRKGSGELFSFFPDAAVTANDRVSGKSEVNVQTENRFTIAARVIEAGSNSLKLQGFTSSLMNGEALRVEISGECARGRVESDRSVSAGDLYDLSFRVAGQPPTNAMAFREEDVLYKTNYTGISNALVIGTNTNGLLVTNLVSITNPASLKLEFAGISDAKKRELLVNYLNAVVNALFRN